jgi:hypothetical protein
MAPPREGPWCMNGSLGRPEPPGCVRARRLRNDGCYWTRPVPATMNEVVGLALVGTNASAAVTVPL